MGNLYDSQQSLSLQTFLLSLYVNTRKVIEKQWFLFNYLPHHYLTQCILKLTWVFQTLGQDPIHLLFVCSFCKPGATLSLFYTDNPPEMMDLCFIQFVLSFTGSPCWTTSYLATIWISKGLLKATYDPFSKFWWVKPSPPHYVIVFWELGNCLILQCCSHMITIFAYKNHLLGKMSLCNDCSVCLTTAALT